MICEALRVNTEAIKSLDLSCEQRQPDNQSFPICLLASFYASGTTMLESMWSSMSSSMQLAQECLERNSDEEAAAAANTSGMEGLEKFAQTIDNS
jgi:hypothetical protein